MWYVWITCVNNLTLQSSFSFLRHCDVSFVMSQLRYQCFCYNNTIDVIFWYVQVTHKSYVMICCFLACLYGILCIMWQLTFSRFLKNVFLITLEMRCLWYVLTTYGNTIQLFCVLGPYFSVTFVWCVCMACWSNVTATFCFCLSLWHNSITS